MKISSFDREVRTLLEAGYYKIPRFQRPYSWTKENVDDFWKDAINNSDPEYFIGSMVVYKERDNYFGIVDGQQRLTTLTIALASIRNTFEKYKLKDFADGIQSLVERKNIDNKYEYVIQTETSYPYFQEYIQKSNASSEKLSVGSEETAIKSAHDLVQSFLDEKITHLTSKAKNEAEKIAIIESELKSLRDKILKLKLIFIELDNEDDAYIIFETLNSRGKDLQVSDLVKNHLTKLVKRQNSGVDLSKDKWKKIVEIIDSSKADLDINDFLLHYWLSKHEYSTLKELFKKFKAIVVEANAVGTLDELLAEAKIYRSIDEPEYIKWDKQEVGVRNSLVALGLFKVRQPKPSLLSVLSSLKNSKNLKLKDAEDLISAIEKFHFLSTAITSQRSSGGVSKMYALLGRSIRAETDVKKQAAIITKFKGKLQNSNPSREEFQLGFNELKYSNLFSKQKRIVQYVLEKTDSMLRNGVPIDYSKMTIEHILPQASAKTDEEHKIVASIGNLMFVPSTLNGELDDKPFEKKKEILLKNSHPLDSVVAAAKSWGKSEIAQRSGFLANEAYSKIWKI